MFYLMKNDCMSFMVYKQYVSYKIPSLTISLFTQSLKLFLVLVV